MPFKRIDLTGQTFGRLTVLHFDSRRGRRKSYWLCRCVCGIEKAISQSELHAGKTRSCGCLNRELTISRNHKYGPESKMLATSKAKKGGYLLNHRNEKLHRLIAEQALGKPLPAIAQVHHVNEIASDNRNENLVICQDNSYHRLLHYRTKAYEATGNGDAVRCSYCGQWDLRSNPDIRDYSNRFRHIVHLTCARTYQKQYRHTKKGAL